MNLPNNFTERVYAGVLGKIIGVYLGRPFEGWPHERILRELGQITGYVHEKRGVPLVVTDDDISGTFTFLRALQDHNYALQLTPAQIGETWLNYLIEEQTILWWGGLGNSTEHTAYLRLKHGISAPESGSIARNGPIVAQQIGAQIFIDGWAMVAPGDPLRAADLARRAGSVSHDGEAVYAAQALAAMESLAFIEQDIDRLLDTGLAVIPKRSIIYRMICDVRDWHAQDQDWQATFRRIQAQYGYQDYIGGCHIVPNHALVILGLLYGEGDFGRSLMVCNTCGWDTDCNSGNLGCLMGIRNGLDGINAGGFDWRGPVADRLYLPTVDGGRCVSDAVQETDHIVHTAMRLNGLPYLHPKGGARFHFNLPGSVQGFTTDTEGVRLENVAGHSRRGERCLAIHLPETHAPVMVSTATFVAPRDRAMPGYSLIASPTLYPGETLQARVVADEANPQTITFRPALQYYDGEDQVSKLAGPEFQLAAGAEIEFAWRIPDLASQPIFAVGLEVSSDHAGKLFVDYLTWDHRVQATFSRPASNLPFPGPMIWRTGWVKALDDWHSWSREPFKLIQNEGRGMLLTGAREWQDLRVYAMLRPALLKAGGLAVRVQGLRRYYSLELTEAETLRLCRMVDGEMTILKETEFAWERWQPVLLRLDVQGDHLTASAGDTVIFTVRDEGTPLTEGAVGFVLEEGHLMAESLTVEAH